MPLKSTVSTQPAPARCAIRVSGQSRSGSSLKRRSGREREPLLDRGAARRDDETERLHRLAERLGQRQAGLAQREIERRGLERPPAVLGLPGLQERERVERVLSGERQLASPRLEPLLGYGVVVDLLAAAPHTAAPQDDDRALEREVRRNFLLERAELVVVDLERQVFDGIVGRHTREPR